MVDRQPAAKFVTERALLNGRQVWLALDAETLAIEPHVRDYALHLTGNGSAENTIKAYIGRVTRFLNWTNEVGVDWKTISLAQLARFKWSVQGDAASEGDPIGGPVAMQLGVGGSWSTVERTRLG